MLTMRTLSAVAILETYAGRWGTEVFFRDAKQYLAHTSEVSRSSTSFARRSAQKG
jgi:hypothetical protein